MLNLGLVLKNKLGQAQEAQEWLDRAQQMGSKEAAYINE
jgi:hypothetical protein